MYWVHDYSKNEINITIANITSDRDLSTQIELDGLINYKIELLNMKIQSLYDFENDVPIIPSELFTVNPQ